MRILQVVGVLLALVGSGFLVAPGLTRVIVRHGLGLTAPPHEASRVAAWGLIVIGLAMVVIGHLAG